MGKWFSCIFLEMSLNPACFSFFLPVMLMHYVGQLMAINKRADVVTFSPG